MFKNKDSDSTPECTEWETEKDCYVQDVSQFGGLFYIRLEAALDYKLIFKCEHESMI